MNIIPVSPHHDQVWIGNVYDDIREREAALKDPALVRTLLTHPQRKALIQQTKAAVRSGFPPPVLCAHKPNEPVGHVMSMYHDGAFPHRMMAKLYVRKPFAGLLTKSGHTFLSLQHYMTPEDDPADAQVIMREVSCVKLGGRRDTAAWALHSVAAGTADGSVAQRPVFQIDGKAWAASMNLRLQ